MTTSASQPQHQPNDKRPLFFAGGLGLVTAILVIVFLNKSDNGPKVVPTTNVPVVVAKLSIPAGGKIAPEMVEVRELPQTAVAQGSFQSNDRVLGLTVRYPLSAGEQVTQARLVEAPKVQAISFQIPAGMRAMTVTVAGGSTSGSLLAPGDFVDVLIKGNAAALFGPQRIPPTAGGVQGAAAGAVAMLIQNVQILTVGADYVADGVVYDSSVRGLPPKGGAGFVTLAVKPEQAQLLLLAQNSGDLTLLLRPFGDEAVLTLQPRLDPPIAP